MVEAKKQPGPERPRGIRAFLLVIKSLTERSTEVRRVEKAPLSPILQRRMDAARKQPLEPREF